MTRGALIACALLALATWSAAAQPSAAGTELLGTVARPWRAEHWLNSAPLQLAQLPGQVVLVRWWTAPECPFCAATAPALNDFHARYAARGLRVIGFYHHKAAAPLDVTDVARYAKLFGFEFPVAIDPSWATLKAWWLTQERRFTSVTFLIDRQGVIRFIHPGGRYVKGEPAHARLQQAIEAAL